MQRKSDEDRADAQKDGAVFHAKVRSSSYVHNADLVISRVFDDLGHVHTRSNTLQSAFQCCLDVLEGLAM